MLEEIRRRTARQIVDAVKDVCGKNINFINSGGIIVASTDPARVDTFHEIGRRAALTGTVVEVGEGMDFCGTQEGVNIPILYHGTVAGVIGISGKPDEVRQYAYLAQKIAVLLLRERELDVQRNSKKERMNYMIRSLTSGNEIGREYFQNFLKEYHLKKGQLFCTLLIRLDPKCKKDGLVTPEQKIYQALEQCGSPLYTFFYPNEYVLFLREEDVKGKRRLFEKLAGTGACGIKIGIGDAEPLSRQNRSYQAAELAVKSLGGGCGVLAYEELDLELILNGASGLIRTMFLEKTIGMLDTEDRKLLETYYEEEQSLARTSRRLNLHKNTLQYRLDRIHRQCNYNPRVFRDAVVLYSAVRLWRQEGNG